MKVRNPKAVVYVGGGVVQWVVVNDQRMEVLVVDFDTDGAPPKGLKKNRDGETCNLGVWKGSDPSVYGPGEVRYWKKKDRTRLTSVLRVVR